MEVPLGNSPWYAFYQRQPYVNYNISRRYDLYCNPFFFVPRSAEGGGTLAFIKIIS